MGRASEIIGAKGHSLKALRAAGVVVRLESDAFLEILGRHESPLLIYSAPGLLGRHKYLVTYKGLAFYTKSRQELEIPESVELIVAKRIWIPE